MVPDPTRRTLLSGAAAVAATVTTGCSMLPGDGNDPDAGTDSYGVVVNNRMDTAYDVTVTATASGGGETVFEETADVPADGSHEWDEVLTGDGLYRVTATVDDPGFAADGHNTRAVSVGTSNAVDAKNVVVLLTDHSEGVTAFVQFDADG